MTLDVDGLSKRISTDRWLFKHLSFSVSQGEQIALRGESGVGKSSLLNLLAGLDQPDEGEIKILGHFWHAMSEQKRLSLRRTHIGFVFQAFHLMPHLTARQNVMVPCLLAGWDQGKAEKAAQDWLDRLGLSGHAMSTPARLSGGEQQRVAVARALVHSPQIVFADEPTGNLDPQTADLVMNALTASCRQTGASLVMVTHSEKAADMLDVHYRLGPEGLSRDA